MTILSDIVYVLKIAAKAFEAFRSLAAVVRERNLEQWIGELHAASEGMRNAVSDEDRGRRARDIARLIQRL